MTKRWEVTFRYRTGVWDGESPDTLVLLDDITDTRIVPAESRHEAVSHVFREVNESSRTMVAIRTVRVIELDGVSGSLF